MAGIDPDHGNRGQALDDVQIAGSDFRDVAMTVRLERGGETIDGTDVQWVSADLVRCDFDLTGATAADDWDVYLRHDDDGKSDTLAGAFEVENPVPAITSLDPTGKTAGGAAFTLTVNGTGFVAGSKVRWNGDDRITSYVSPTLLTGAIPASDIASARTVSVTVFSPGPGGGTSDGRTFTVTAPPPSKPIVGKVVPSYGPPGTVVTITGSGFGSSREGGREASVASCVSFNGVAATEYRTWTDTRIVCTVPEGAVVGPVYVVTVSGFVKQDRDLHGLPPHLVPRRGLHRLGLRHLRHHREPQRRGGHRTRSPT